MNTNTNTKTETVETKTGKPSHTKVNPFRDDSLIGTLFMLGHGKARPLNEILDEDIRQPVWEGIRKVTDSGRRTKLSMADKKERAYYHYTMISSTKHKTNGGRAKVIRFGRGDHMKVRFAAVA